MMKKNLFFAAMALVALASCTSDEMVEVATPQDNSPSDVSKAIVFSPTLPVRTSTEKLQLISWVVRSLSTVRSILPQKTTLTPMMPLCITTSR